MSQPSNFLVQVQTYQMAQLAFLLNYGCFIHTANKKFKDFNKLTANLGDTVTFDLPPRYVTQASLVATFQSSEQRVQTLVCNNPVNTSYAFTTQQFIFNVEDYMKRFGRAAVAEIATNIEAGVARLAETQPYRFYGDGVTQISSAGQLATMLALYRTYGFAHNENVKVYLSDLAVPQIVNNMQNQFTIDRNNENAMSWMVGDWMGVDYYQSNLLPVHIAGSVGQNAQTLTVVSTNDPTGNNITQITCSGANVSDPGAVVQYDSAQFNDGVSGQPNMRYLTFVGHKPSGAPVQVQITANAGSDGSGNVILNISPALCYVSGNPFQNISFNVVAGMQLSILPSHRCGLVFGGDAMFLAMPQLNDQPPYPTAVSVDEESGVSTRLTYGTVFTQNQQGFVHDALWGATLPAEYSLKLAFPL